MRYVNAPRALGAPLLAAALSVAGCLDEQVAESSSVAPYAGECSDGIQTRVAVRSASARSAPRYLAKLPSGGSADAGDPLQRLGYQILDASARTAASPDQYEFVEIDGLAEAAALGEDPRMIDQWHLPAVYAPQAWSALGALPGAPIAIVDSGVFGFHPDLDGRILPGWNFLTGTADTIDIQGHGTSVAGAAGAIRGNGVGIAGLSPSPLLPLVVLDSESRSWYSDIARAIVYAADQGVRVINVSIGGEAPSRVLQDAVDYAWSRGCLVVASAMNHGGTAPRYPAACENVMAVGALDPGGLLASFSARGPWVDLVAPGVSITTTVGVRCYGARHGTSFAAPLVAGVAALVLAVRPEMPVQDLVEILTSTCDDLGAPGIDDLYGAGRVNAMRAVDRALHAD